VAGEIGKLATYPRVVASSREQLFLVDLVEKTGSSVVTGENFLPPSRKNISDK